MEKARRVVVTGMGVVSPVGMNVGEFWKSLCEGRSGIGEMTRFDTAGFAFTRAGEIRDFQFPAELKSARGVPDRATQFMLAAAREAMEGAGLGGADEGRETGVVFATNFGGMDSGERFLEQRMKGECGDGSLFAEYSFQRAADWAADLWNLAGPRAVLSLSCSSGTAAIGYGMDLIRAGRAQAVLTGGYDAISRFAWSGLSCLRTMTRGEVRPFDKNRDGTIFSEGAGALVVEDLEHARRRGAKIHAEVMGHGFNNNAGHMTAPDPGGMGSVLVMRMALSDAGIRPEEVDHINAHGTATKYNDLAETQAIKTVFGEHAYRMPVTANKSITGHLMGAAGSAEAIASILSIRDGVIPPTINFAEPDPECDLDCVPNTKRETPVRTVLSNSSGIGGCNAAVIFRRGETRR